MSPPGPQAGDLGMVFFPEFWKVPDVQPLMTHIEATSKPILESITAETGVIWPPLEEFEAEWAHHQKGENKRTVPQRAEPFRNAHNCSLTRVYCTWVPVPEQITRPPLLKSCVPEQFTVPEQYILF